MGYLSQKKKEQHINTFLNYTVVIFAVYTLLALSDFGFGFSFLRNSYFLCYLILLAMCIYAFVVKRWLPAISLLGLIIINFVSLSSYTNIFFNTGAKGTEELRLIYQNHSQNPELLIKYGKKHQADILAFNNHHIRLSIPKDDNYLYPSYDKADTSLILSTTEPKSRGKVYFSSAQEASYVVINKGQHTLLILNIDFSNLSSGSAPNVYKNMTEFVKQQNVPVLIVGDFGMVSWSPLFQKFLIDTGLEVKNHVILSDGQRTFDLFNAPQINVLGYKTLGLKDIEILGNSQEGRRRFLFKIIL